MTQTLDFTAYYYYQDTDKLEPMVMRFINEDAHGIHWEWARHDRAHKRVYAGQRNRYIGVVRLLYLLTHGPDSIPEGAMPRQTCGKRWCIRPSHQELFWL